VNSSGVRVPFVAALLLAGAAALAGDVKDNVPARDAEDSMEVVLVTGEQPGPALWRVSSVDHTLWILGEVSPLPRKVRWRSKQVESLLGSSQEVILHYSGYWTANRRQTKELEEASVLPDGKNLRDQVSPDLYERVLNVQKSYGSHERLDRMRPYDATRTIHMGAVKSLGLAPFSVSYSMQKLAGKAKVKVTSFMAPSVTFEDHLRLVSSDEAVACLEQVVGRIEDGGAGMRRLANAWSTGDIDALRQLVPRFGFYPDGYRSGKCSEVVFGSAQKAADMLSRRNASWLKEAERALRDNAATVAVVPVAELFAVDGYLAGLRAKGYTILEPG
jgi:uncharacterized protein YbaP (TraB family)